MGAQAVQAARRHRLIAASGAEGSTPAPALVGVSACHLVREGVARPNSSRDPAIDTVLDDMPADAQVRDLVI